MICPACNAEEAQVAKTIDAGAMVTRKRVCPACGSRWLTMEGVVQGSLTVPTAAEILRAGVPRSSIDPAVLLRVFERDRAACRYCSADSRLTIDHVVPLSHPVPEGQTMEEAAALRNSEENLVTCCLPCNLRKGTSVGKMKPRPL